MVAFFPLQSNHTLITEVIWVVSSLFSYMKMSYLICELKKELGRHLYLRSEVQVSESFAHDSQLLNLGLFMTLNILVVGLIVKF